MFKQMTLETYKNLGKKASRIAVFREIAGDQFTPISIVEALSDEMQDGVILESGLRHEDAGRYSFISFGSEAELRVERGLAHQRIGNKTAESLGEPLSLLRKLMKEMTCAYDESLPAFLNGAVGFLSYEAIRYFEKIPNRHGSTDIPDFLFRFYQSTLMYDHLEQKILISIIVTTDSDYEKSFHAAQTQIDEIISKISQHTPSQTAVDTKASLAQAENVDIQDEDFIQKINEAKQHIVDGDAFQIVLSRCFSLNYTVSPFDIYRSLRRVSPAPYMFYLPIGDSVIIGASPEKLVRVYKGEVEINPIAGTRQRLSAADDARNEAELLSDKKELAEHTMLVDLARNDLGAVCVPGSVKVSEYRKVKHYSHVSHLTSVVIGEVRKDKDVLDVLVSSFPAGTLSGAPKIRAMEIIDELETSGRGIYGGAICRLDYEGNLETCIAIRMAHLKDGKAKVRTGAGIVYDSDPKAEAQETRQKAKGVLDAIRMAENMPIYKQSEFPG